MIERKVEITDSGAVDFIRPDGSVCHPHGAIHLYEPTDDELHDGADLLARAIDAEIIARHLPPKT